MGWYLIAIKNYAGFGGRARRKEYFYFQLFNFIIIIVFLLLDILIYNISDENLLGIFTGAYSLGIFIPNIAVTFRRLHDTGRSGWWLLINFVPMVGTLIYLFFLFSDSQPEENQYGPFPKSEMKSVSVGI